MRGPNDHASRMTALIAHCTCPDADSATRIARALVEERLAACVQVVPGLVSTYRWDGAVREGAELLLLIKTTRDRFAALKSRLPALHPYAQPELVATEIVDGLAPFLEWMAVETSHVPRSE